MAPSRLRPWSNPFASALHLALFGTLLCLSAPARAAEDGDEIPAPPAGGQEGEGVQEGRAEEAQAGLPLPPGISLRALLQVRYRQTWTSQLDDDASISEQQARFLRADDGFRLQRAVLRALAEPTEKLSFKLSLDFAELYQKHERRTVRLAYVSLKPVPRVQVMAGLFKRPFSLLQLLSASEYEFAEDGPTDRLIKNAGFSGRDVGVAVKVSPLPKARWLRLSAGLFHGDAEALEASPAALMVLRATSRPIKPLELGVDFAYRPRTLHLAGTPLPTLERGRALSADATLTMGWLELRAEGLWGTRADVVTRRYSNGEEAGTFLAFWGLVRARTQLAGVAWMPALRAEWLDADRERPIGERLALSGALTVEVDPRVRLLVDATRTTVVPGTQAVEPPLDENPYLPDANTFAMTAQLQVVL